MYKIIETKSIEEEILKLNGLSLKDLDVRDFKLDLNQEYLLKFKEELERLKDKKFFIIGDYDFDGISSTTIICRLFDYLNIEHNYYIPSRISEGYGINKELVDRAKEYNFECILCLDNGIVAYEEIEYAKSLGIEVLIIDHHEYDELPKANAIIHPRLLNDNYIDACTAGLTYLLSALFYEDDYSLVLSGIACLADMVKVVKYNRFIIKKSYELLNTGEYANINLLNKKKTYTYQDISFNVIPKVNAVSRLGYNANKMVTYFLCDGKSAFNMISDLEEINNERKRLTSLMNEKANSLVIDSNILVICDESFKEGLCGIVSSRITNEFNKPSIILSKQNGILKGSARSTNTFNLYEYLLNVSDLFETFGGHEKALGLSLKEENLNKLLDYISNNPIELVEEEKIAIKLDPKCIDIKLLDAIEKLTPFGTGLKEPMYAIENNSFNQYYVSGKYPKWTINPNCEAILFDLSKQKDDFKYFIGKLQKDAYHKGNVSIILDDLVV